MKVGQLLDRSIARVADRVDILAPTPFGRMIADHPIVAIDVGSRGGFEADLLPMAWAVDAFGFEPDPVEFARLQGAHSDPRPWRSLRLVPTALSGASGTRTLHIPVAPQSASLLEHDARVGEAYGYQAMFTVDRTADVTTTTLDEALERYAIPSPHYLKLDIEGIELEVLSSAPRAVEAALVVKTEVSFLEMRKRQPLATDVDLFLRDRGFRLVDLVAPTHWRRNSHVGHPQLDARGVPYSRGELAQGDFLYFKEPDASGPLGLQRTLQAATLAMAHGFFDYAGALLGRAEVARHLRERYGVEPPEALRSASLAFGRRAWAEAFAVHLRRIATFLRSANALGLR